MILEPEEFKKKSEKIGIPMKEFFESMDTLTKDMLPIHFAKVQNRKIFFCINEEDSVSIETGKEEYFKAESTSNYIEVFTFLRHISN